MRSTTLWALTIFIVAVSCLEARIELNTPIYSTGDTLNIQWRLSHSQEEPLEILRWGTPLEGEWNANFFNVVHFETGKKAVYAGKIMKNAFPTDEHFAVFAFAGVHQGILNLAAGYRFYSAGTYTVTLSFSATTKDGSFVWIESNTLEVFVEHPDEEILQTHHQARAIGFVGCSASQQNIIVTAENNAQIGVDNVNLYMSQSLPPSCSTNYVEWFGTYSTANWNEIKADFLAMTPILRADSTSYDCSTCITNPRYSTLYAYVYPVDTATHTIYLCGSFWNAPNGPYQTDSKAGTIVHELSHFNDIAATLDNAYGQTACRSLAISNPTQAVNNADSHEYLVEAHPVCAIAGATSCGNGACDLIETFGNCPGDCTISTCGNVVCDGGELFSNCPVDCVNGGVGGDPHLFSFDGSEIKAELSFRDGVYYSFYSSPSMQIVIRNHDRFGIVVVNGIGIKVHQQQFLAIINEEDDPEFYLNGIMVVDSIATPFGLLELFTPSLNDLVGPLSEMRRYVEVGTRLVQYFTVVAGYHPRVGGFFNLAVHQAHDSATGLLVSVSRNHNIRDLVLEDFETSAFF